jgi:hypothetical protein
MNLSKASNLTSRATDTACKSCAPIQNRARTQRLEICFYKHNLLRRRRRRRTTTQPKQPTRRTTTTFRAQRRAFGDCACVCVGRWNTLPPQSPQSSNVPHISIVHHIATLLMCVCVSTRESINTYNQHQEPSFPCPNACGKPESAHGEQSRHRNSHEHHGWQSGTIDPNHTRRNQSPGRSSG